MQLEGFEIKEKINRNAEVSIFRAVRKSDKMPVVLKSVSLSGDSSRQILNLKKEFDLLSDFDSKSIVKTYGFSQIGDIFVLVLEDGGDSLKGYFSSDPKKLNIKNFLKIAISIASALAEIHRKKIVHKDIKPTNIVIRKIQSEEELRIIDFGISTRLGREEVGWKSPEVLEGSLPYISPEQTGRVNKMIDYRSDFYSLGITFYELLTGILPFANEDPVELIHSHIAKYPLDVTEVNSNIPPMVSKIIRRLMEKDADKRYQSSLGIKYDLEKCLRLIEDNGKLSEFSTGEKDYSDSFKIPQKLYGREKEIEELLSLFSAVSNGKSQLLLVSGYSGIGKSAFINETHKPITAKSGYFIAGKFDQFQRNIPFSAIARAFRDLMNYLLTEPEEKLKEWKSKLVKSLGMNAQVIIDIIPELEYIIGKQQVVPVLDPTENQNRFNLTFQNFIKVFTKKEHPIVLFIDDLQWADTPSLNLIKVLITNPDSNYLLIIGAYRDNEVDGSHPLIHTIDEIKKAGSEIRNIHLGPLAEKHIQELVSDTLQANGRGNKLCQLLTKKTGGNPFFLSEFLKTLYKEEIIDFNYDKNEWEWEDEKVFSYGITDNVVDLMVGKLRKLPENSLQYLSLAACLGSKFTIGMLATIAEVNPEEIAKALWLVIEEGMLIPIGKAQAIIQATKEGGLDVERHRDASLSECEIRFQHDRVQQAAYSFIPEDKKKQVHLSIGRLLLKNTKEEELDDRIFDIIRHFNEALELITDKNESIHIAKLNLEAAEKAKRSAAFSSALNFLNLATQKLTQNDWEENYDLIWRVYKEKASCEFSSALLDDCENTVKIVLPKSITEGEKVSIYKIYLNVLFQLNKHFEAIEIMREALLTLGIKIPKKIGKQHVAMQYVKFRMLLGKRKISEILKLPENMNEHILNICRVLYDCVESTYIVAPDMMGYVSVLMANYCLKYGNSLYAPFAYAMVTCVMTGVTKELELAYELSLMTFDLNEKYPNTDVKARINFLAGNFSLHWARPVREHLPLIQVARISAKESGNIHWGNYATTFCRPQSLLFNTKSLAEIEKENLQLYEIYLKSRDREVILNEVFLLKIIQKFKDRKLDPYAGWFGFDEEAYKNEMATPGNFLVRTYYYTFNMVIDYTFENYESALGNAWKSAKIVLEVLGNLSDLVQRYYFILTYLMQKDKLKFAEKLKFSLFYKLNRFLIKYYAKKNPTNFLAHWLLIQAEEARVNGLPLKAMELYNLAIEEAKKAGFIQNRALANELAAKFYISLGNLKAAEGYLQEALDLYSEWGAVAKVIQLEEKYPDLIKKSKNTETLKKVSDTIDKTISHTTQQGATVVSSSSYSQSLDLASIVRASQAISGEIELDKLLSSLIKILIENAGAERVVLIGNDDGKLLLEAEGTSAEKKVYTEEVILLQDAKERLPVSIVQFVARAKTSVVLNDASRDEHFQNELYFKKQDVKSVLCAPLLSKGKLSAIIYMENNLTTGAFTEDRVQTVKTLASQATISIENAKLYNNMEQKVKDRTKEIGDIMDNVEQGIMTLNEDLTINPEYSRKVAEIFGRDDLGNKDFYSLFPTELHKKIGNLIDLLYHNEFMSEKMLKSANPLKEYSYISDSKPVENVLSVGDADMGRLQTTKQLSFSFSRIYKEDTNGKPTTEVQKVMVVIDDRTAEYEIQKRLEAKAKEQASKVEKLYQILGMDAKIFSGFIKEANETIESIKPKLVSMLTGLTDEPQVRIIETNRKIIEETFRAVHSLKGNARALNLESIGERAHKLEDELDKLRNNVSDIQKEFIERTLKALDEFHSEIKDGSSIFEKILGMKSALGDSKATPDNPVKELEDFLRTIVKKESAGLGKEIDFEFSKEGEDISVDLLAKLKNPLIQIVKNSIDHGIEKAEVRVQSGKSAKGKISVKIISQSQPVDSYPLSEVICEDDGGGLNVERIKRKAIEVGLITEDILSKMPTEDIYQLIFHPGFSTADKVTGISGRGVGMDIVRDEIERLGGSIRIQTSEGKFTRFSIVVPK